MLMRLGCIFSVGIVIVPCCSVMAVAGFTEADCTCLGLLDTWFPFEWETDGELDLPGALGTPWHEYPLLAMLAP